MPLKPKHPCNYPGCPALTEERYCEYHKRAVRKAADVHRGSARERGYTAQWGRVRTLYLRSHPLCDSCKQAGFLVPAVIVHHIRPIADGGGNEESNLQALCDRHHRAIHQPFRGREYYEHGRPGNRGNE